MTFQYRKTLFITFFPIALCSSALAFPSVQTVNLWTVSMQNKIDKQNCFQIEFFTPSKTKLSISYRVTLNKDGTLTGPPRRITPRIIKMNERHLRHLDINAQRAIEKCAPYNDIFPPEHYDEWKDFEFHFGVE